MNKNSKKYKNSPLPFGVYITHLLFFIMLISIIVSIAIISAKYWIENIEITILLIISTILLSGISLYTFNNRPSPFEQTHEKITSFTGGGSIYVSPGWWWGLMIASEFLFPPNWPCFRLLIYKNGLEIRLFFHCFFIPYDLMENPFNDGPIKIDVFLNIFSFNLDSIHYGRSYLKHLLQRVYHDRNVRSIL